MLFRVLYSMVIFGVAAWSFYAQGERETGGRKLPRGGSTCFLEPLLLPGYFLCFLPALPFFLRSKALLQYILNTLLITLLLLCVYYALLLCALPLLRRCVSPRACAALYVLPTFLYLLCNFYGISNSVPPVVLTLPRRWLRWLLPVWLGGFLLILLWQVCSHIRFRRALLKGAQLVDEGDVYRRWRNMQMRNRFKRVIPLMVSPRTSTPLTIGLFSRTMRLVLPHTDYAPEELELIFSHELRHIQRADTRTKALLGFCTALCWFDPLMWISRRRVAEDLELSCDELVLYQAPDSTRAQYAGLLLNTAGDGRGYTTCLSAGASSLRYRLKRVVRPASRSSGALLVGLVLGALILSMGCVALADSPGTVWEQILSQVPEGSAIDHLYFNDDAHRYAKPCRWDGDALIGYLSSLTVRQVYTGTYSPPAVSDERELGVIYTTQENGVVTSRTTVELYEDGTLCAYLPFDDVYRLTYVVEDEIDWSYLSSLLEFE